MADAVQQLCEKLKGEIAKIIVGQDVVIEELLIGLVTRGHVLLEGVPGLGKTLLSKTLACALNAEFRRIQFTPDLMPSDIIGTNIFDFSTQTFKLRKGPVFTDILLSDEINRTPPKTQSALLEAMEERQVSIDGNRFELSKTFFVIATQNPIEYEGTYPLPEAQLDRFMLKSIMRYPEAYEEKELYSRLQQRFNAHDLTSAGVRAVADCQELFNAQESISRITVSKPVIEYIYNIISSIRVSHKLFLGPSPRAAIMLITASKALAARLAKDFVTPDEVKQMALPVLRHRIILKPEAEVEGLTHDTIIRDVIEQIKVPR